MSVAFPAYRMCGQTSDSISQAPGANLGHVVPAFVLK